MATTNPIALLSSEGDELFADSGLAAVSSSPPTLPAVAPLVRAAEIETHVSEEQDVIRRYRDEDEDEPVPETLRSSVFVCAHEPVSRPIVIEMVDGEEDHRAA